MHGYNILYTVALAILLYQTLTWLLRRARRARLARQLGCAPAPRERGTAYADVLGIRRMAAILDANRHHRFLDLLVEDWARHAGDDVLTMRQRLLWNDGLVTVDPENIQAMLATRFEDWRVGDTRRGVLRPLLGEGIFNANGAAWHTARSLLRPQFARAQIADLALEERHLQVLFSVLPLSTTDADGWTPAVNVVPLLLRFTMDTATEFLFGESVHSQTAAAAGRGETEEGKQQQQVQQGRVVSAREFTDAFNVVQRRLAGMFQFGGLYRLARTPGFLRRCRVCHAYIDFFVRRALDEKAAAAAGEEGRTKEEEEGKKKEGRYVFLDAIAHATDDPILLRDSLLSILIAGRDTTATLLSWTLLLLSRRPDIWQRLREDVLAHFGPYYGDPSRGETMTFAGLKACAYLQWVLQETLRLHPVVPLNTRQANRDTVLPRGGGPDGTRPVLVAEGEEVLYSVHIMHRLPRFWGAEDAEAFRPERWRGRKMGWEYLPFNGGPRVCIGQQFALTEAGYVLARLAQRFVAVEEELPAQARVQMQRGYGEYAVSLTATPAWGVNLRFKEETT